MIAYLEADDATAMTPKIALFSDIVSRIRQNKEIVEAATIKALEYAIVKKELKLAHKDLMNNADAIRRYQQQLSQQGSEMKIRDESYDKLNQAHSKLRKDMNVKGSVTTKEAQKDAAALDLSLKDLQAKRNENHTAELMRVKFVYESKFKDLEDNLSVLEAKHKEELQTSKGECQSQKLVMSRLIHEADVKDCKDGKTTQSYDAAMASAKKLEHFKQNNTLTALEPGIDLQKVIPKLTQQVQEQERLITELKAIVKLKDELIRKNKLGLS